MNALVLHHLKAEELPIEWAKQLPIGQRFTITITAEKPQADENEILENAPPLFGIWQDRSETQDVEAYMHQLRQGRFHAG